MHDSEPLGSTPRDPVCGREANHESPFRTAYEGREYLFCSQHCLAKFTEDPGHYLESSQSDAPGAPPSARLRTRNPHDLRHNHATLLFMDHYSPAYVQRQLGHHSISMTVDIYGHRTPGEGKKYLTKTLRGAKAKPGRLLSVVEGRE